MYNDKNYYLTPKDIYEHAFKVEVRGYSPQEVDKYLDMIIRDYTEYNKNIKALTEQLEVLNNDNYALKQEIRSLQDRLESAQADANSPKEVTNIDLLKRISQLEKVVYGKNE